MTDKKVILVIDDDKELQTFLEIQLVHAGFTVILAKNGKIGLKKLEEQVPNVILLDVQMPVMDGIEFITKLRSQNEFLRIPVIFLTAEKDLRDKVLALSLGSNDYVVKPFEFEEVLARIRVQLRIVELEQKVIEAERLKVLSEMAGAAAHQLSQPLTGAIGYTQLILSLKQQNQSQILVDAEDVEKIHECLQTAIQILEKIRKVHKYKTMHYSKEANIIDIDKSSMP